MKLNMKSMILFAFVLALVSSAQLAIFNILTGNSTAPNPFVCMLTKNATSSNQSILSLGNSSIRYDPQCTWSAVDTGTNSGFQLVNMKTQNVVALSNVSKWSAIGEQSIMYPPPAYTPVALGISAGYYRPSIMVWNVVGNGQDQYTPVSLYSQQPQTLISQNQAFWFVNRDFVLPGGTDGTQIQLDNMFLTRGQTQQASLRTQTGGSTIYLFSNVAQAVAARTGQMPC